MEQPATATSRTSRIIILCLAAACAGLGIYLICLRSDLASLRGELAATRRQRDEVQKGGDVARAQLAPLQENVARLTKERDGLRERASLGDAGVTAGKGAAKEQPYVGFAQAFATPEMRQMVRREAMNEARKGFSELLKKWSLPPGEANQFLEFVADRDSADTSDALAMLATGRLDGKSIAEQEAKQEKMRQENNARLKALLGAERYAEFEAADAREAENQAVSTYRDHLESAGSPLSEEQRSALAKIVTREKPDEDDWQPEDVEFFTKGMTDAQISKLRQRQEAAHGRITQQATSFLSPDQIAALQAAFRTELEEQDLALKMARTFFQTTAPTPADK